MGVDGGGAPLAVPEQPSHRDQPAAVHDALSKTVRPRLPFTCYLKVRRSVRSLMVAWMGMGVLPMCSLERLSAARSEGTGAAIPGRERGPRGGSRRRPEGRLSGCYRTEYRHGERAGRGSLNASSMRRVCQTAFNIDLRSACKIGSVAISMMSAVYGRQMPANGGQIDNLGAFQRQTFGMCRSGCAQNPPRRAVRSHHHRD